MIAETKEMSANGLSFAEPQIDIDKLRGWKEGVVKRLTGGLAGLAKQRKVEVVRGTGVFTSMNQVQVTADDGSVKTVSFEQAIIAAGSEAVSLPFIPNDDPRVIDSTGALELEDIPQRLLVLGGGIIGLEMATVYSELGAQITVVELMDQLIPGADKDIVTPLTKRITKQYQNIYLKTKVTAVEAAEDGLRVRFEGAGAPETETFDKVLVAVGRRPNGRAIGAENAGVRVDERGYIQVDKQQRTNVPHIFAIGDIVGQPMLAHKATTKARLRPRSPPVKTSYFDAQGDPVRGLHRSRSGLGGRHRERGEGRRCQVRQRSVSVGRVRPVALARPGRRHHEGALRRIDRSNHRLRHRRAQRRRPHRRGRDRDRNGCRRG